MKYLAFLFLVCLFVLCGAYAPGEIADSNSMKAPVRTSTIAAQAPEQLNLAITNQTTVETGAAGQAVDIHMLTAPEDPLKVAFDSSPVNVRLTAADGDEELEVEVESDSWWTDLFTVLGSLAAAVSAIIACVTTRQARDAGCQARLTVEENRKTKQAELFNGLINMYGSSEMGAALRELFRRARVSINGPLCTDEDLTTFAKNWVTTLLHATNDKASLPALTDTIEPAEATLIDDARRMVKFYFSQIDFLRQEGQLPPRYITETWSSHSLEELNRVLIALEGALLWNRHHAVGDDYKTKISPIESLLDKCYTDARRKEGRWTDANVKKHFYENVSSETK